MIPSTLRFGIPSLDRLFGTELSDQTQLYADDIGIYLDGREADPAKRHLTPRGSADQAQPERLEALAEELNAIAGELAPDSLLYRRTKRLAKQLSQVIETLRSSGEVALDLANVNKRFDRLEKLANEKRELLVLIRDIRAAANASVNALAPVQPSRRPSAAEVERAKVRDRLKELICVQVKDDLETLSRALKDPKFTIPKRGSISSTATSTSSWASTLVAPQSLSLDLQADIEKKLGELLAKCALTTSDTEDLASQKKRVLSLVYGILSALEAWPKQSDTFTNENTDTTGIISKNARVHKTPSTCSVCVSGPSGTGKSALALHMASRYAADTWQTESTCVLYASTDFSFEQAHAAWDAYQLYDPRQLRDEFPTLEEQVLEPEYWRNPSQRFPQRVYLRPVDLASVGDHLLSPQRVPQHYQAIGCRQVGFVDLQQETAGDDWQFLNRIVAELPQPAPGAARHLLIIDAVEGLETFAGETDSFGVSRTRRSRVAQIIRSAAKKCHIVLITEGENPNDHAEKYVSDFVVRIHSEKAGSYLRRSIEIEKARGRAHVRGKHPLLIRSGAGTSTGGEYNPDDPYVNHAYIHVVPSLDYIVRNIMWRRPENLPLDPSRGKVAEFGIAHLDSMLREGVELTDDHDHERGIPLGTVAALIGDEGTQKSRLGTAFGARHFVLYVRWYVELLRAMGLSRDRQQYVENPFATGARNDMYPHIKALKEVHDRSADRGSPGGEIKDEPKTPQSEEPLEWSAMKVCFDTAVRTFGIPTHWTNNGDPDARSRAVDAAAHVLRRLILHSPLASVYITTRDLDVNRLSATFVGHLTHWGRRWREFDMGDDKKKQNRVNEILSDVIRQNMVCRRLETHDMPAATLFFTMRQCIAKAQRLVISSSDEGHLHDKRALLGHRIRLVIDDWRVILDTYDEIRQSSVFLPFLLFFLRREGVTTLIVHTAPGIVAEPVTGEPQVDSLADYTLRTWRVRFNDAERVAIAAIPPIATDVPTVTRELRWTAEQVGDVLTVDPNIEMYSGLAEGKPLLIPLRIRLNGETPQFVHYAHQLEQLFHEKFPGGKKHDIVVTCGESRDGACDSATSYENLRDLAHLQNEARLDHTLVFMVDEFWMIPDRSTRTDGSATISEPSSRFRNQSSYLRAVTWRKTWGADRLEDPHGIFQPDQRRLSEKEEAERRVLKRHMLFNSDVLPPQNQLDTVDRVPFMANFGFLLCNFRVWKDMLSHPLGPDSSKTVDDVWAAIYPPHGRNSGKTAPVIWRDFLGACRLVSEATRLQSQPLIPFAVASPSSESMVSLVLEIWASEIHMTRERLKHPESTAPPTMHRWVSGNNVDSNNVDSGLIEWLCADHTYCYRLELYFTLLLLAEVFNRDSVVGMMRSGHNNLKIDDHCVARREWYTTAAEYSRRIDPENMLVPCILPGHYSVRGDWYLAVARGSRSQRLADAALDILGSVTNNIERMRLGLGLPTRLDPGAFGPIATPIADMIPEAHPYAQTEPIGPNGADLPNNARWLTYTDVLELGPIRTEDSPTDGHASLLPLWRSGLRDYDRHARMWRRWIARQFEILLAMKGPEDNTPFSAYDAAITLRRERKPEESDKVFQAFNIQCDQLVEALKAATPKRE
jgi:hypothetical protein